MSKTVHIQAHNILFTQNFCKGKTLLVTREKLYRWPSLLMNIKLCYKRNGVQGWLFCWFFHPPKKLDNRKCYKIFVIVIITSSVHFRELYVTALFITSLC